MFFTRLQMALWMASLFVFPQLLSSAPEPPRLMFATLMFLDAALAATQLMPATIQDT